MSIDELAYLKVNTHRSSYQRPDAQATEELKNLLVVCVCVCVCVGGCGRAQAELLAAIGTCAAELVIVSNETGQGIVPDNALARRFREAQGRLNIALAAKTDCVVQVIAGLPQVLKGAL